MNLIMERLPGIIEFLSESRLLRQRNSQQLRWRLILVVQSRGAYALRCRAGPGGERETSQYMSCLAIAGFSRLPPIKFPPHALHEVEASTRASWWNRCASIPVLSSLVVPHNSPTITTLNTPLLTYSPPTYPLVLGAHGRRCQARCRWGGFQGAE